MWRRGMTSTLSTLASSSTSCSSSTHVTMTTTLTGLPSVTLPLASRPESCVFTIKPLTHTVADFCTMIKAEDKGIDLVVIRNLQGIRVASQTCMSDLLAIGDFCIELNGDSLTVSPPNEWKSDHEDSNQQDIEKMRGLVSRVYAALDVEATRNDRERSLLRTAEDLRAKIEPMEAMRRTLEHRAEVRATRLTWTGLGLMAVQFGVLARLTWWEYSWDIMEPVTYFVTYGTAMACYAYFVLTGRDYVVPDVRHRHFLLGLHKSARRQFLDVDKYNLLKASLIDVEAAIEQLRREEGSKGELETTKDTKQMML